MNIRKVLLTAAVIAMLVSSFAPAQEMKTMKMDSSKDKMMSKEMKKDKMSHDMMDKKMSDDKMMKDKEMMHDKMMTKIDKNMDGVAIKGYDPVAYFTDKKAEMGNEMHSAMWMGAKWQFKREANKMMFEKNPEKYAPQYGGYCAYGVGVNSLFSTDPTVFTIEDGKLYLNKNKDVGMKFNEDVKGNIAKAEKNWPMLNKESGM